MERWMVEEKLHLVKWSIVCLEQSSRVFFFLGGGVRG